MEPWVCDQPKSLILIYINSLHKNWLFEAGLAQG